MLIDTHCHIHESELFARSSGVDAYTRAVQSGIRAILCIGTNEVSSREAVEFAGKHPSCFAVVGVHPHDVQHGISYIAQILKDNHKKVVGIGEIGLDYYYTNSPKDIQIRVLEQQLQWAIDYHLPVSFHVRDAFDDFWPIFSNFSGIKGVLHSFTDSQENLERGLSEGLYIGINGISTFTKDEAQIRMYDSIPLKHLLLETDAPFLTPVPHRGKVNEPAFVRYVAEYHVKRRGIDFDQFALTTSTNASTLFSLP